MAPRGERPMMAAASGQPICLHILDGEGFADVVGPVLGWRVIFRINGLPPPAYGDQLPCNGGPINVSTNPDDDNIVAFFEQGNQRFRKRVPVGTWAPGYPVCVC